MPITYIQKQKILEFLSNPANWKNHFDLDFFMDEKRKWHTQSKNGITVSTSNDKKEIFVVHEQTGSAVHIKKEAPKLSIRDESGRGLSIQSKLLKLDDGTALTIEPITSAREFNQDTQDTNIAEIDEMGVRIGFHNSGLKTVFLADSGQKITFEKPTSPIKSTSHPGQFFHVISFSLTTAKTWGMEPSDLWMLPN